jgi:hypothetical protein
MRGPFDRKCATIGRIAFVENYGTPERLKFRQAGM